jgi:hypothetical protein
MTTYRVTFQTGPQTFKTMIVIAPSQKAAWARVASYGIVTKIEELK